MPQPKLVIDGVPVNKTQDLLAVYEGRLGVYGPTPEALLYTRRPENHANKMADYYEILSDLLQMYAGAEILDIGCGYGSLADAVPPDQYHGIDVVGGFIEKAGLLHPDHRFEVTTLEEFSGATDVSVFAGVMGSVPDPFGLLRRAWEISRMGVVVDFNLGDQMPAGSFNRQCRVYTVSQVEAELASLTPDFKLLKEGAWNIYHLPKAADA